MSVPLDPADARALERVEADARRDFYDAAPPQVVDVLGVSRHDIGGGAAFVVRTMESLLFNRVSGFGVERAATEQELDRLLALYAGVLGGFAINHSPLAAPPELESWYAARGMGTFFHHLKWWRDVVPKAPHATPLRIARCTAADAGTWAEIAGNVFGWAAGESGPRPGGGAVREWIRATVGRPGWSHFLAWDGAVPIATGALFVRGGHAWLGWGGTLEAHRRKGAQRALIAARIAAAAEQGARLVSTETGPDWEDVPRESLHNVRRAGFQLLCERPSWILARARLNEHDLAALAHREVVACQPRPFSGRLTCP